AISHASYPDEAIPRSMPGFFHYECFIKFEPKALMLIDLQVTTYCGGKSILPAEMLKEFASLLKKNQRLLNSEFVLQEPFPYLCYSNLRLAPHDSIVSRLVNRE